MMAQSKKLEVRHEQIDTESAGQRIDNYLVRILKGVPKSHVYRLLRSGQVRVGGRRVAQTYRLQVDDLVRIPPVQVSTASEHRVVPVGQALPVLYEDEALLILDKPAGQAVHGGSGVSFGVIEQLRRQRPDARLLELAHRLDRETSGLLIVAKKRAALAALHELMRNGGIEKHYVTVVSGRWMNPRQHIRTPLYKYLTGDGERRVRVQADGKPAHSIVTLMRRWETVSQLGVELKTGRTHQIRVHLTHQGFPLVGDDKYGDFALNKRLAKEAGLTRMFLHAARLRFAHPLTGAPVSVEAPLPPELQAFLKHLDASEVRDAGEAV
ncbi:RluA family pseudouridine synthase [Denitromonas iodatirespirans]|uniref:Pseudouridine synthase n=1 Tax=Denitromonas iodatirespirans TaxID=2795389 RepID=A0A944H7N6_DENI1|nr:RluA family pseudouridine synthase [Denitromonas iodatirespirans]MBT0961374.1 RluA family pseudouridine synthase [Denitromonas iodatirespirans]